MRLLALIALAGLLACHAGAEPTVSFMLEAAEVPRGAAGGPSVALWFVQDGYAAQWQLPEGAMPTGGLAIVTDATVGPAGFVDNPCLELAGHEPDSTLPGPRVATATSVRTYSTGLQLLYLELAPPARPDGFPSYAWDQMLDLGRPLVLASTDPECVGDHELTVLYVTWGSTVGGLEPDPLLVDDCGGLLDGARGLWLPREFPMAEKCFSENLAPAPEVRWLQSRPAVRVTQ